MHLTAALTVLSAFRAGRMTEIAGVAAGTV
jgi:hypothetical protein